MDKIKFEKLTPKSDADIKAYKEALDFAFKYDDIRNVGISGDYGSGKSSIISSYKKACPDKRFLHISLANFEAPNKGDKLQEIDKNDDVYSSTRENILEGKILNQLIHQIDQSDIPQTNFRVKRQVNKKEIRNLTIAIIVFFCSLFYNICFKELRSYAESLSENFIKNILIFLIKPELMLVSSIIIIVMLGILIYTTISMQRNKIILRKFSVKGNEIEIFREGDDSYFDKYLNDVLYLFENSGADAIVFEDMDRFNTNQIFQRLREINTLINNRRSKKTPLRFLYLLRDDIFVSKDRTKFFDFIIPVVPVLDGSNSYDQFIEHFRTAGILKLFDSNFLQGVSLYIDNMRILKNVYNEFQIYRQRINTTGQDSNKLLAIIIYKNLFPRDFSDLQLNLGFVHAIFANRENFIVDEINKIRKKRKCFQEDIEKIRKEIAKDENELDIIYRELNNNNRGMWQEYRSEKLLRMELIHQRQDGEIEVIKKKIVELDESEEKIVNLKMREIINRDNIDSVFSVTYTNNFSNINNFEAIKSSEYFDLLKYLIRNGYIDETYSDYMTYFYEKSLSIVDKVFLRSVTDEKAKDYSYSLKNIKVVIERLRLVDFDNPETLNFDLMTYLLRNEGGYVERINRLFQQLKKSKKIDFISGYYRRDIEIPSFVKWSNKVWPQMFKILIEESDFTEDEIRRYSVDSIYYSEEKELLCVNEESGLSEYISKNSDFLNVENPNIQKIITSFELLSINFENLNLQNSNYELWEQVYHNNMYVINGNMIALVLKDIYGITTNDYFSNNLTLLMTKEDEAINRYIQNNMDIYLEVILSMAHGKIIDDSNAITLILNDESITDTHKKCYIDVLESTITDLNKVPIKWWRQVVDRNLVNYTEENILCYFFKLSKTIDDALINFINHSTEEIKFTTSVIDEKYEDSLADKFLDEVVRCNALENHKYIGIINSINMYYDVFDFTEIDSEKIDLLINSNIVNMNLNNLRFIRSNYPENLIHFIEKNIKKYASEVITSENFVYEEVIRVLDLNVNDLFKIELLRKIDRPISIIEKRYSIQLNEYILLNNFEESDLEELIKGYQKANAMEKSLIEKTMVKHVNYLIKDEIILPFNLLKKLLQDGALDKKYKLELFSFSLPEMSKQNCEELLEIMELSDVLGLFDGKRPTFEINYVNKRILDVFEENKWITKFSTEKDYYRAYGKKSMIQESSQAKLL